MIKAISLTMFIVLAGIAALHTYWAFGGLWPAQSEQELINTVIGSPDLSAMPAKSMTLVVSLLILASAVVAVAAGFLRGGVVHLLMRFAAGGIAGYVLPGFHGWELCEPFATLNAVLYSPLIIAIGIGFLILALAANKRMTEL